MIARFFQALINWLYGAFQWLGGLLLSFCTWIINLFKACISWIADAWQVASLRFLDFVLSLIPNFDLSNYSDVISRCRVIWAEWNNILPLNTAFFALLLFLDCYLIVVSIKFVKYLFNRFCDLIP